MDLCQDETLGVSGEITVEADPSMSNKIWTLRHGGEVRSDEGRDSLHLL